MSRPTYRVFYDKGQPLRWHVVNPDGTPTSASATPEQLLEISLVFALAVANGETWVVDFFTAVNKNGKANLRGKE